jgi:hypothetical protein
MKAIAIAALAGVCLTAAMPAPSVAADLPHFQCYTVTTDLPANAKRHKLRDQFGSVSASVTLRPRLLCAPTDKDGEDPKLDLNGFHLVCYSVTEQENKAKGTKVVISNQFGSTRLTVGDPTILCVPTKKKRLQ